MSYEYKTEIINQGNNNIFVMRLPKEIALVETFLYSDIQRFEGSGNWFLEAIDKVLIGQSEFEEITGNVCSLEITKEKTKILDCLADDGIGDACEIETSELKNLILVWLEEKQKFELRK